jgi:hypothetical protein
MHYAREIPANEKRLPIARQPLSIFSDVQSDQALALVSCARSERSA